MSNIEAIREYRASVDAAEGVALANGLRAGFLACVDAGEMSEPDYLFACAQGLDEIRERAGTDPKVHERRARRQRDALVAANMGLVGKVAKRTLGARASNPANVEEAIQEGSMGLVRAIEAFDEARGKFSTCAGFWIRHYVQNCMHKQVDFAKQRPSCMPASVAKNVNRFRLVNGREPEPHEVGVDAALWAKWLDTTQVVSVEDMAGDNPHARADEMLVDERTSPDEEIASMHLREKLEKTIAKMSPRNQEILRFVFVEGHELQDAADHFGLSFARVAVMKTVLEKRLRKALKVVSA